MPSQLRVEDISQIATAGFYLALRVGFAFPVEEVNRMPAAWTSHYARAGFFPFDPVMRWVYANTGTISWNNLPPDDPRGVLELARRHGLRHGLAVSVFDDTAPGHRSFGVFAREDRAFSTLESRLLSVYVGRRHAESVPPATLTAAEREVLAMYRDGQRLKEIAHVLGVSEGAVKQRLKNAKLKLEARTSTQAAAIATQYGLI